MSHSEFAPGSMARCRTCGELAADCVCNVMSDDGGCVVPAKFTPYLEAALELSSEEGMVYLDDPRIEERALKKLEAANESP